jgi:hypothetical protein
VGEAGASESVDTSSGLVNVLIASAKPLSGAESAAGSADLATTGRSARVECGCGDDCGTAASCLLGFSGDAAPGP